MAELTVVVQPETARALRHGQVAAAAKELAQAAQDLGVVLRPMDPGTHDEHLIQYFTIQVPDEQAERVQERLAGYDAVVGIYLKPAAEPP